MTLINEPAYPPDSPISAISHLLETEKSVLVILVFSGFTLFRPPPPSPSLILGQGVKAVYLEWNETQYVTLPEQTDGRRVTVCARQTGKPVGVLHRGHPVATATGLGVYNKSTEGSNSSLCVDAKNV